MKLTLIGSRYNEALLEHTKKALSDTLSPVKKTSIAKSFLTRFLGVPTEHSLEDFIKEKSNDEGKASTGHIVTLIAHLTESELSKQDNPKDTSPIHIESIICLNSASIKSAQEYLFQRAFPDHREYIVFDIVTGGIVQDFIYDKYECAWNATKEEKRFADKQRDLLQKELLKMEPQALSDWLIQNINILKLTRKEFFTDFLCDGGYEITITEADVY